MFLAGGYNSYNGGHKKTSYMYSKGLWLRKADMGKKRSGADLRQQIEACRPDSNNSSFLEHVCGVIKVEEEQKIVSAGGENGKTRYTNTVEIYTVATDRWTLSKKRVTLHHRDIHSTNH